MATNPVLHGSMHRALRAAGQINRRGELVTPTGPVWCCYVGGDGGGRESMILAIVLMVFAFFVGVGFMGASLASARDYGAEIDALQTSYEGDQALREHVIVVWKGLRDERYVAALSQGIMTIGAGLLTATLIIAFLSDGKNVIHGMAYGGAGAVGFGATIYIIKQCIIPGRRYHDSLIQLCSRFNN